MSTPRGAESDYRLSPNHTLRATGRSSIHSWGSHSEDRIRPLGIRHETHSDQRGGNPSVHESRFPGLSGVSVCAQSRGPMLMAAPSLLDGGKH